MVGIATLTMKASTPNMNCAATTIASTHQRRDESTGAETIWCMGSGLVRTLSLRLISGFGRRSDYLRGKESRQFGPIAAWKLSQTALQPVARGPDRLRCMTMT